MSNRLIRLRQISASTSTQVQFGAQQNQIPVNGLADGAGVAVDPSGTIYVADPSQHIIFKVRWGYDSQILAGSTGNSGLADGQGSDARFNQPMHMACDNTGNIYVIDAGNERIRRITPNGNVTTIAAIPGIGADKIGGIAVDDSGHIFFIEP